MCGRELAQRFGLGTQAQSLVRGVVSYIFDQPDGMAGFISGIKARGAGPVAGQWLGNPNAPALAAEAVVPTIGDALPAALASRLGLDVKTVTAALGWALPKIVGLLTPDGIMPAVMPVFAAAFLGTTAPSAAPVVAASSAASRWLWPAIIGLAALGGVWYWMNGRHPEPVAPPPVASTPPAPHPAAPPAAPPPVASAPAPAPVPAPAVVAPAPLPDRVTAATDRTLTGLSSLRSGFSAGDLVKVLNASIINFDTASAALPDSSRALLDAAAAKLKTLPSGTVIEVSGHTDNTGDAALNLQLSQQRADAVRAALIADGVAADMLVAKGYGSEQPVASNDTDEGRAENRRIEYRVER